MKFSSFLEIKNKNTIKELKILKEILSKNFEIKSFLKLEDPYIFVKSNKDLEFEGVRIYKIGSNWAYRIQNESDSEPYGKAYPLNVEEMFQELIPDNTEEEAGEFIAKSLIEEFNNFFSISYKIQNELGAGTIKLNLSEPNITSNDNLSNVDPQVVVGSNSGDFSNSIHK
jgi:hypothetical protein